MPFSGMLCRVALVRTDVSEESIAYIIRVTKISELELVTAAYCEEILLTLIMEAIISAETSVLTRTTQRHILEDGILHSRRRENLGSYMHILVDVLIFLARKLAEVM
jgi:hypothetical protein